MVGLGKSSLFNSAFPAFKINFGAIFFNIFFPKNLMNNLDISLNGTLLNHSGIKLIGRLFDILVGKNDGKLMGKLSAIFINPFIIIFIFFKGI